MFPGLSSTAADTEILKEELSASADVYVLSDVSSGVYILSDISADVCILCGISADVRMYERLGMFLLFVLCLAFSSLMRHGVIPVVITCLREVLMCGQEL